MTGVKSALFWEGAVINLSYLPGAIHSKGFQVFIRTELRGKGLSHTGRSAATRNSHRRDVVQAPSLSRCGQTGCCSISSRLPFPPKSGHDPVIFQGPFQPGLFYNFYELEISWSGVVNKAHILLKYSQSPFASSHSSFLYLARCAWTTGLS